MYLTLLYTHTNNNKFSKKTSKKDIIAFSTKIPKNSWGKLAGHQNFL